LVIAVKFKGSFYLDDIKVQVDVKERKDRFIVRVHQGADRTEFVIGATGFTEIAPSVWVTTGYSPHLPPSMVRLIIKAPKEIRILRSKLYLEEKKRENDKGVGV